MLADEITVEVRDKNLKRLGQVGLEYLDLKAVRRHLGIGQWTVRLPREHDMVPHLWARGAGVIITVRDQVFMSGPVNKPSYKASQEDPAGLLTFTGVDDNVIVADALSWPLPSQPDVTLQTDSHDVRSGIAETVMREYVNYNIGPGAPLARRGLLAQKLVFPTDQSRGPSVQKSPRFQNLADLITEIALYSSLGWRVVQVGSTLQFQVYEIRDRHKLIRFDIENQSLEDQEIEVSPPSLTRVIVAAQGEQENRKFLQRTSAESQQGEAEWGRVIEFFKDQRQTNDDAELEQAGDEELTSSGFTAVAVKAVPSDDDLREFGTDWLDGDIVSININGQESTTTVTEVAIVANSGGVTVAAAFGDVSGFDAESAVQGRVTNTENRLANLERNSENMDPNLIATKSYVDAAISAGSGTIIGAAIGVVQKWSGPTSSIPAGWLLCDGRAVSRSTYGSLFAVIGTTYGAGDGSTTFNLPQGTPTYKLDETTPGVTWLNGFNGNLRACRWGAVCSLAIQVTTSPAIAAGNITDLNVLTLDAGWRPDRHTSFTSGNSAAMMQLNTAGTLIITSSMLAHTANSFGSGATFGSTYVLQTIPGGTGSPPQVERNIIKAQMLTAEVQGLDTTVRNLEVTGTTTGIYRARPLGSNVNLNDWREPGPYVQTLNANASLALNYPVPSAGLLEEFGLQPSDGMRWQRYSVYSPGSSGVVDRGPQTIYQRSWYTSTGWSAWMPIFQQKDPADRVYVPWTQITSFDTGWQAISGSYPRPGIFCRINEGVIEFTGILQTTIARGASASSVAVTYPSAIQAGIQSVYPGGMPYAQAQVVQNTNWSTAMIIGSGTAGSNGFAVYPSAAMAANQYLSLHDTRLRFSHGL